MTKAAVKTKSTAKAEAAQKKTATKAKTAKKTAKTAEKKETKGKAPVTATNAVKKAKAEVVKEVTQVEPETKEEAKQLEGEELQEAINNQVNAMRAIETRSINGKLQHRMIGKRKFKNAYGHYYGTIGSKIDRLIEHGVFTKKQIKTHAGTKMSKVNSHIAHLRRDVKKVVIFDEKKRVLFG